MLEKPLNVCRRGGGDLLCRIQMILQLFPARESVIQSKRMLDFLQRDLGLEDALITSARKTVVIPQHFTHGWFACLERFEPRTPKPS